MEALAHKAAAWFALHHGPVEDRTFRPFVSVEPTDGELTDEETQSVVHAVATFEGAPDATLAAISEGLLPGWVIARFAWNRGLLLQLRVTQSQDPDPVAARVEEALRVNVGPDWSQRFRIKAFIS